MLVVFEGLAPLGRRLPAGGELLLGAEAVVGLALLHQLLGVGQVHALPFALNVGAVVAADVRPLVPLHADALEGAVDHVHRPGHVPGLVRVLDAQDELAAVSLGVQVGVEGAAQVPQVHVPRGAGGESCTYGIHIYYLILQV